MSDALIPTEALTDLSLLREWECVDCDSEDTERSDALAAELKKRNLDF